jgi:hypothetical protein
MQKTWGPFTGRQLTAIILGVIAAIMVPGAAYAVDSFTNVAIEDPVSGAKASVDATHHVVVGDGSGALTVDGTVTSKETSYANLKHWSLTGIGSGSGCLTIATPTAGKALVIKTLHIDTFDDPTPGAAQNLFLYYGPASAPCTTLFDDVNPGGVGVTSFDFGNGLALPAGSRLAIIAGGQVKAEAYAFGFEIAGSGAPPNSAATTPNVQQK